MEPIRSYTISALQPSGSILVHPNMLSQVCPDYNLFTMEQVQIASIYQPAILQTNGLTLPGFHSPVNPFRVELITPFFIIHPFVLTT
ncbi:hypothetical protein PAXINDRAFT_19645 [Paxillus involutus ATCC 200175]|uniref:Uncharacterized protein n=1 Tax=Paxillus involutus ATCC 200175 TaxID=664439 RepID=A0A0C9SN19_PAXIN|nr:hypothetical protein PAXINDRAFT_19645 [Paxillus involutus ATCC 200175]